MGVHIALTAESIAPQMLGPLLEEHEFESLFVPEHAHIYDRGRSLHPEGGPASQNLARFFDPFGTLAAMAALTSRVRLGTGVCLIMQHDPLVLAKVIAKLDVISNGRAIVGVGAGWNREEMLNHGTAPATRWQVMRERVLALRALWTTDVAEYHGRYVDFDPVWQWSKPVQRPHPPVLIGGEGPRVLKGAGLRGRTGAERRARYRRPNRGTAPACARLRAARRVSGGDACASQC